MPFPESFRDGIFSLSKIYKHSMTWFLLVLAGLFEIAWAVGLKYSQGFTKLGPTVFTIISLLLSMGLLSYCVKSLPLGTAYGIWTGIGAVGTALLGIILFNEPRDALRIFFIILIIAGITGLKLVSK